MVEAALGAEMHRRRSHFEAEVWQPGSNIEVHVVGLWRGTRHRAVAEDQGGSVHSPYILLCRHPTDAIWGFVRRSRDRCKESANEGETPSGDPRDQRLVCRLPHASRALMSITTVDAQYGPVQERLGWEQPKQHSHTVYRKDLESLRAAHSHVHTGGWRDFSLGLQDTIAA